ncbi:MAG: B12-binding domain-containing radical SAM protein [Desulfobacteraceae bacterium]|nr:B12-binding domain-containing radical SAM protein [Desulfobacteraceae bacterium]
MKNPDIIIIKPGSQKQIYGQLSSFDLTAIEPPLWGAIIAGFLRENHFKVELIDAEAENLSYKDIAIIVRDLNPLLAVVMVSGSNPSASTMNMTGAGQIVRLIKDESQEIATALAGLHPSALPQQTMEEEQIDFLIQGEGFQTFPGLITSLKDGLQKFDIPGLWYRDGDQILSNDTAMIMKNLDFIPQPAWDMLPMDKYRAHNWHCFDDLDTRQSYAVLYTSLGCPFRCSFCCINSFFGQNTIRYRSIDNVITELDFLVNNYGVTHIKIIDEMFALNEKRVVELCDKIIERDYGLNIWAYARVNTVTQPMLAKMKEAGINWLAYGFESGSKRVIEDTSKGYKFERVMDVVKMTYDHDIHICSNFIFGLPEDDYDSMNETLSLMQEINAEWSNIYSAMAYPGSNLYDTAIDNNWPLPDSWQNYSQYSFDALPLPSRYLSGPQVLEFRDYAFDTYYKNPRYLNMIKNKFGVDTMDHIKQMASHKLKRKYI